MTPTDYFRRLMSNFPTGVTVLTTYDGTDPIGMTATAFTSLSLDPLLLLVCVRREARLLPAVRRSGAFAVNLLAGHQANISRHFGGRPQEDAPPLVCLDRCPVLAESNGAFICGIETMYPGGDHEIVLGRVLDFRDPGPSGGALVYRAGSYDQLPSAVAA